MSLGLTLNGLSTEKQKNLFSFFFGGHGGGEGGGVCVRVGGGGEAAAVECGETYTITNE